MRIATGTMPELRSTQERHRDGSEGRVLVEPREPAHVGRVQDGRKRRDKNGNLPLRCLRAGDCKVRR